MEKHDEPELLPPQVLAEKFKSKRDLYKLLVTDLKYFLPSYKQCSLSFIKQILSGEKKAFKRFELYLIDVPDYDEFSMKNVYPELMNNPFLSTYLPDHNDGKFPEKDFFYTILATAYPTETEDLIKQARKNRAITSAHEENEMIKIQKHIKDEIMAVLTQKSTTGRAVALLKNGAKGKVKRKPSIKFRVDLGKFSVEPSDESANRRKFNKVKAPSTPQVKNLFTSTIKSKRDEEEKMMF